MDGVDSTVAGAIVLDSATVSKVCDISTILLCVVAPVSRISVSVLLALRRRLLEIQISAKISRSGSISEPVSGVDVDLFEDPEKMLIRMITSEY